MRDPADLPALLQSFFTTRLMTQRKASPHTIASYRDTFRLLLQFAQKRLRKAPSQLALDDLDTSLVGTFLEDLEKRSHNAARSRNLRLTAIRSFFRLIGTHHGVSREQLQVYLDEFVFRHNRRRLPTAAFQTLLGLGAGRKPTAYKQIRGAADIPKCPPRADPKLLRPAETTG